MRTSSFVPAPFFKRDQVPDFGARDAVAVTIAFPHLVGDLLELLNSYCSFFCGANFRKCR